MITEFSIKPKPQNKRALILFSVFFFLSAVLFIISSVITLYRGVVGFTGLLTLVSAILIYTKYVSVTFCYDVMIDSDDVPIFIVRQIVGKRQQTLLRVELADIASVTKETRKERRAHVTEAGVLKYNYTPTLMPEISYRLKIVGRGKNAEVVIEGTDEFAKLISDYSIEARGLREVQDEE